MSLLQTVREERSKYGTPLGHEGAWKVCNAVCLRHVSEGWGLVDKPTGTNWLGYSTDVILNRFTGEAVDILGSSETDGIPVWNVLDPSVSPTVNRWRQPVGDIPPNPNPNPQPGDLTGRVMALEAQVARIVSVLRGV